MFIYKRCVCKVQPHDKVDLAEFEPVTEQMKLLSAPSRLAILSLLSKAPHCVCDLETHTGLSQTLLSHHLKNLAEGGLIESSKESTFVEYRLTKKGRKLVQMIKQIK
jgi:ArsR family transcriptional regulator